MPLRVKKVEYKEAYWTICPKCYGRSKKNFKLRKKSRLRFQISVNEFEKAKRVHPENHPMIGDDPTLRVYQGDMVHQISTANIIFMPSLVINVAALGQARFPMAHRHGGGDYLYWMDLIQHGAKFAFSTLPEVRCGSGINMWYGSGWGTDGLAMRVVDEARFLRTLDLPGNDLLMK